eukprot:scaffold120850_cov41-Attheya_sp.AAC.1
MRTPPISAIASNTMHMHAPFVRHSSGRTTMTISSFPPHCTVLPRVIVYSSQLLTAQLPYHTPKECESEE